MRQVVFFNISFEPQFIKLKKLASGPVDRYNLMKLIEIVFANLLNNLEGWGLLPGSLQFSNLLKLLNNQLCQDSSISFL